MNGMKIFGTATLVFTILLASQAEANKEKAKAPAVKKAVPMMSFEECCDLHEDTGTCQSLSNVKDKKGKSCPKIEFEVEDDYVEMDEAEMDSGDE